MSPVRDAHEGSALCHLDGFLQVQGTGFLYKMVRHLTGVLIAVGEGVLPVETVTERLKVGNSTIPGVRASEAALAQHPVRTPMNDAWSASRHPPADMLILPQCPSLRWTAQLGFSAHAQALAQHIRRMQV